MKFDGNFVFLLKCCLETDEKFSIELRNDLESRAENLGLEFEMLDSVAKTWTGFPKFHQNF